MGIIICKLIFFVAENLGVWMKILVTFFFLVISSAVFAQDLPPLREGLWESTTTESGKTTTTKHCIGSSSSIKSLFEMSQSMMQGFCSPVKISNTGNSYTSSFNCKMGESKVDVESTVSGDFNSSYSISGRSVISPPIMGQSGGTSSGSAKYLGRCPSDMKAGDLLLSNGSKVNLQEMASMLRSKIGK